MKVSTLAGAIMAITLAATSAVSMAADKGHGTITFKGSIIDAPLLYCPKFAVPNG
ncbi:hypothetical protein AAHI06_11580 [Pseudomonas salmasensis]|uniref:hypothetical protein n=1 Tax=Pseudomonas salmasensis TaxID=2745514 RepID=UPI003219151F